MMSWYEAGTFATFAINDKARFSMPRRNRLLVSSSNSTVTVEKERIRSCGNHDAWTTFLWFPIDCGMRFFLLLRRRICSQSCLRFVPPDRVVTRSIFRRRSGRLSRVRFQHLAPWRFVSSLCLPHLYSRLHLELLLFSQHTATAARMDTLASRFVLHGGSLATAAKMLGKCFSCLAVKNSAALVVFSARVILCFFQVSSLNTHYVSAPKSLFVFQTYPPRHPFCLVQLPSWLVGAGWCQHWLWWWGTCGMMSLRVLSTHSSTLVH